MDGKPATHNKLGMCLIVESTQLTKDLSAIGVPYVRIFDLTREIYVNCLKSDVMEHSGEKTTVVDHPAAKPKAAKKGEEKEFNFW
jgi:hypothetical protein